MQGEFCFGYGSLIASIIGHPRRSQLTSINRYNRVIEASKFDFYLVCAGLCITQQTQTLKQGMSDYDSFAITIRTGYCHSFFGSHCVDCMTCRGCTPAEAEHININLLYKIVFWWGMLE